MKDTISKVKNDEKRKIYVSWKEIETCIANIMHGINDTIKSDLRNIYPIPRGGFIPAVILSHRLNLPIVLKGSQISGHTLIVDDIEDSGKTISQFDTQRWKAVLISKKIPTQCEFFGEVYPRDKWIVFPWEVK